MILLGKIYSQKKVTFSKVGDTYFLQYQITSLLFSDCATFPLSSLLPLGGLALSSSPGPSWVQQLLRAASCSSSRPTQLLPTAAKQGPASTPVQHWAATPAMERSNQLPPFTFFYQTLHCKDSTVQHWDYNVLLLGSLVNDPPASFFLRLVMLHWAWIEHSIA